MFALHIIACVMFAVSLAELLKCILDLTAWKLISLFNRAVTDPGTRVRRASSQALVSRGSSRGNITPRSGRRRTSDVVSSVFEFQQAEQRLMNEMMSQEYQEQEYSRRVAYFRDEHHQAELVYERVWTNPRAQVDWDMLQYDSDQSFKMFMQIGREN
eukprot:3310742-Amphidinium_carterae.1